MPSWKTHIEIAKRISEKLNITNNELNEFMIGSILPDINNGYVVKKISNIYSHKKTHYEENGGITYVNFYNQYKNLIKEPLILGYYVHLYTDYIWNNDFYSRIEKNVNYCNYTSNELREIKHNDFKLYNNKYVKNTINIINIDEVLNKIKLINNVSINKKDLINAIEYLNTYNIFLSTYKFYKDKEMDHLLEDVVKSICEKNIDV